MTSELGVPCSIHLSYGEVVDRFCFKVRPEPMFRTIRLLNEVPLLESYHLHLQMLTFQSSHTHNLTFLITASRTQFRPIMVDREGFEPSC